jgi:hypothetical protein
MITNIHLGYLEYDYNQDYKHAHIQCLKLPKLDSFKD